MAKLNNNMQKKKTKAKLTGAHAHHGNIPVWHSLMYSTSILLVFCGIPATVILAWLNFDCARSRVFFGASMVFAETTIAALLYVLAKLISKYRNKRLQQNTHNDTTI